MQLPPSEDVALPAFQALLTAGGRSSRMGQDKAFLTNNAGIPLYLLQRQLLLSLKPRHILLSGRPGVTYDWPPEDVLLDSVSDCGPLAAIEALARYNAAATAPLPTLVLAVDLPFMAADYLRNLLLCTTLSKGIVATTNGRLEPLVAVYPPAVVELAQMRFHHGVRAVHHVLEEAVNQGLMQKEEVPPYFRSCFTNVTTPEDVKRWLEST